MGSQPSKPSKPSVDTNESEKSARNVLEGFAESIKKQAEYEARKYKNLLKGELKEANFYQPLLMEAEVYNDAPSNPCHLDHTWYTNINDGSPAGRNPCHGRNQKRFDEGQVCECGSGRIKGNENNSDGGSCAPPRRRHMCDKNLEALTVANTKNSNDLLGNILVTAKYEGQSIVNNHPDKDNYNNKSSICTSLARSFADIGDIIRGKDLFLGGPSQEKKKLEENLKKIFEKIKKENKDLTTIPLEKIREYWWAIHRKEVWEALTCNAPPDAYYFVYKPNRVRTFTNPKCGHNKDGDPLTNLDYVPQFLRWFDEWSEEFCRIKNIKLGKVKNACRGETSGKRYCSGEGYDCTKTDLRHNNIFVDLDCPNCEKACRNYQKWIENKRNEFIKQKNKYNIEINNNKRDTSHSDYDQYFYQDLKNKNNGSSVDNFLVSLNEGKQCRGNNDKKYEMDFKKPEETFGSSEYCGTCPLFGVKCEKNICTAISEEDYKKGKNFNVKKSSNGKPTQIDLLISDTRVVDTPKDFNTACNNSYFFKGIRDQKWKCQYIDEIDRCTLQSKVKKSTYFDNKIAFKVLIERWLKDFLEGYNESKLKIGRCTKYENSCIKGCKHKCECVEKWIKKKEVEWDKINQHYNQQKKHYTYSVPSWVNSYLTHQHFSSDFINALEAFDNISSLKILKNCKDDQCKINKIRTIDDDLIKELISKLKDKCAMCKNQHKATKGKECCGKLPKTLNDQDDEEDEDDEPPAPPTTPSTPNPCVNGQNQKVRKIKRVRRVAKRMQKQASVRHDGDISKLKANAKLGQYNNHVVGSALSTECDIRLEHSNRNTKISSGPCAGKDGSHTMFQVENGWENGNKIGTANDVFLPPRRQHFCTSNLEHLITGNKGLSDGTLASHSLLGDVLLSAKFQANFIKERYNHDKTPGGFKNEAAICRAIKYSFADIGDIIKGTDLWDEHKWEKKTQSVLVKIFQKIKDNLPVNIKGKYNEDEKHLELRSDWWEANRHQVWKAMQCKTTIPRVTTSCDTTTVTPLVDYIPQRLRWMTEWAEWYCKVQKEAYGKLVAGCKKCTVSDGTVTTDDCKKKCKQCKQECEVYKDFIQNWKKQWTQQSEKYQQLYNKAAQKYTNVNTEHEKPVVEYLSQLHTKSGYTDKYSTAGKYVVKEGYIQDCQEQKEFGNEDDIKYPFKEYPHKYENQCNCTDKPVPLPPSAEEAVSSACNIVDKTLGDKTSKSYAEGCRHKYKTRGLEGWECNSGNEDGDVCIPPRRQRLYVYDLQQFDGSSEVSLREAFIKSAAIETFFSWHEFKKEKEKEIKEEKQRNGQLGFIYENDPEHPQNKLNGGQIPDEFKRQMFYTLADYRDILFGKNIGTDMSNAKDNIRNVFENIKSDSGLTRKGWWGKYGEDIWKGMLCALSYDTETKEMDKELCNKLTEQKNGNRNTYDTVTISGGPIGNTKLDKFASRPQYFRWLEEWGEEFCRKRTYMLKMIKEDCRKENSSRYCDGDGFDCTKIGPNKDGSISTFNCPSCAISCRFYKKWISKKKEEFDKQSKKYEMEITDEKSHTVITYDNEFYKTLKEKYNTATKFLETLKGPYSNNITGESTINFHYQDETFAHAKNCSPCPVFGVKCKEDDCSNSNENMCHEKLFKDIDGIENKENTTDVHMLVIDNNKKEFAQDLHVCEGTGMFDGIRNNKWSCGYLCDYDVCVLQHSKDGIHDKQNIPIIVLFKLWVENFLKDYNKIKEKFSQCINNKNKSICIKGCTNKCKCVGIWIEKKKEEWKNIKERYQKQYRTDPSEMSYFVLSFLESLQTETEVEKAIKPFKKLNDLHYSNECTATDHSKKGKCENNDIITILLNKLKKEINDYQTQHKGANETLCYEESHADKQTEDTPAYDIPLGVVPPPFCNVPPNPCSDKSATNVVNVTEVAKEMQEEAHKDMLERSGKDGETKVIKGAKVGESETDQKVSVLRGNIKDAKFKNGASGKTLNSECEITKEHTNDSRRGYNYRGPCTGKNQERFKIGTDWKDGDFVSTTHKEVFMPPRRQHFCTSNLEKINVGNVTQSGNINPSFLVDVLLAAKEEADFIKRKYGDKIKANGFNDNATMCRALKYSFADIGDIIKGTDMWDGDRGEIKTQGNLVTIFDKIKDELKEKLNGKYDSDKDDKKYINLRTDWWEANRDQVWEAMKCPTIPPSRGGDIKCAESDVPFDDYIPQRLRWMTEWAEWYCKYQSQEYEVLMKGCKQCREKGEKCMNGEDMCNTCTKACEEYAKNIKKWEEQWIKIKTKYEKLYEKAKQYSADTSPSEPKDEKDVVAFLKQLHEKNKDSNKIYETAEGYIHQEAHNSDCQKQTRFCKNPSGNTSSGKDDNKEYAFSLEPHEYKGACKCKDRPQQEDGGSVGRNETFDETTRTKSTPASEDEEDDDDNLEDDDDNLENDDDEDDDEDDEDGDEVEEEETEDGKGEEEEDEEDHGPDDHDGDSHQEEEDPVVDNDVDQGETTKDTEGSATEEAVPPQPPAPKKEEKVSPPPTVFDNPHVKTALMSSTIMWSVGISFAAISYFLLKKKPKSPVDLIRVLDIHKGDYEMPTLKSKNRYIPYRSGSYKGKTYIYMEGDSDSGHYYEDTTDITSSSESEYEELDINDIYVPGSPKYKTLIEVVLEPSKRDTPSSDTPMNKFTDEEWNELKHDFISQYVQSEPLDVPQYDVSTELPMNIGGNVLDNGINEKPFITSIHDRDLYTGEQISYNINMSTNSMDDPKYVSNNVYSGIDLINDTLSGNQHIDIYDELLKRKENELFGTNYKKNTSNNSVAKELCGDPIMNQINLFHKWLDRHRNICENWGKKEDILNKLKEEWEQDNNSGDIRSDNHVMNTNVSIQIDMDETKGKKEFTNMDTILDNIEDDIYYDVNDENPSVDDISMNHNRVDVPKKVHVEMKILNNTSNGSLEQEFPISDVWNI
ncbi:hypothetical protein C923_02029 [Plasmodium falciparum UGT5.1]|uniref:Erythrocyte membrane protein 1, PfEMP1 n=1 Tax=Plasmodium falciparum UGT5.1 TaxID=1237627 RepID=W7K084_PLAFA|nr:hypothetical protein C923_02029 [Plasmodium falciparum UGT5.1]